MSATTHPRCRSADANLLPAPQHGSNRVERRTAGAPRPRVVSVEWLGPVVLGGTWMPELITTAGGDPLGVEAGAQAPTLDMAALGTLEPEVVVIKPCGYPVERILAELELLPAALPWGDWPAVRMGAGWMWPTATPTSTAAAPGSSTRPSSWPAACTRPLPRSSHLIS